MRAIQFNKNIRCFWVVLLVFICLPLFSFFSDHVIGSAANGIQISGVSRGAVSGYDARQRTLPPMVNQNPAADVFIQSTDSYQSIQRASQRKNNICMTAVSGLSYGFLFPAIISFIYLSGQLPVIKFDRHLIIPHSAHAPPGVFS